MTRNDGRTLGWERMARTGLGAAGLGIVLHAAPSVAQTSGTNSTSTAATLPPVTVEAPIQARPRTQPAQRASQSSRGRVATQRNARPAPAGNPGVREAGAGRANASSESSYVADSSSAGTKTNTPLLETPQSISVVTRKELNDRAVQSLTEAVGYEPGVRIDASGFDPRFDAIAIRGFDITYNGVYLDGLRLVGAGLSVFKAEPYGVDSITVVRGPSSALYGLGSPGGLIDLSSKLPTSQPFHEVQTVFGDRDRIQGNFDLSGPVDANGQFSYRLTGVVRDADVFVPGGKDNRTYIAPAVTWKPDQSTTFTILGSYQKSKTPGSMFTYSTGTGTTTDIFTGSPSYNSLDQEQGRVGYLFEHAFNNDVTVRQKFRYVDVDAVTRYVGFLGAPVGNVVSRYTGYVHDTLQSAIMDNQVEARLSTGPVQHTLLIGTDYTSSKFNDKQGFGFGVSDLNLAAPVYAPESIPDPAISSSTAQRQTQSGVYVQDQARLDHWILTLSGRSDWVRTTGEDLFALTRQTQSDQAYSGRAGLTYVFDSGVAPYVAYSTSFFPNLGVDPSGAFFKPTTGKQTEVGVKYQPQGTRSFITAAVFDLTQDGGLVTTGTGVTVQRGEIQSRGFELQALASLGGGFDITSSYTYLDMVTKQAADDSLIGKFPSGNPPHTATLWANYALPLAGPFAGLSFGGGARYMSWSYGDDANTFKNSSVTLIDAALKYDFGQAAKELRGLQFQVNAKNLFNLHYTTCQVGYCYRGAPLTVIATLGYRW
ncbi:iron complex outermembrane receptor protein [Bradyrhizobium japonicum]|uniref:Iron complex outermembrane receptor protein n=1 Tax=Bradyrhizobium japonicum TaxID=375 RepID=A0ABV2RJK6_BRAJP|nr:TonB-dependent siderophore receptor [Bradyrhizobium japonicum]UQD99164.1 TonB-dependent siderophore receptor [Bradyrhizobium japonicum]WLB19156.1 TonB-dependent siderophore receptor [Bradyrhizobium japonicum]